MTRVAAVDGVLEQAKLAAPSSAGTIEVPLGQSK
jgi:hypothetical protein